jgi:transposase
VIAFSLSSGSAHDAPEGRKLLANIGPKHKRPLLMDRAHEGDETRELAVLQGFTPVVPPKSNRKNPLQYDKQLYKRRNEIERLFLRLKRFRKVFTRYDKLDVIFTGVIPVALIYEALI